MEIKMFNNQNVHKSLEFVFCTQLGEVIFFKVNKYAKGYVSVLLVIRKVHIKT